MTRPVLLLSLLFITGCYTPITSLKGYVPDEEVVEFPTPDSVLAHYFTPEAYSVVKDIPTVHGLTPSAYAAGTSNWASIASWISGSGTGRKAVFSKKALYNDGYKSIVHEYVHHLDDMTRDDPENHQWINREVFMQAYRMLTDDYIHKGIQRWCDSRANDWIPAVFGIGEASEHIAYIAIFITGRTKRRPNKTPDYLKAVFGRILKVPYKRTSLYITTRGKKYIVTASPDKIELVPLQ